MAIMATVESNDDGMDTVFRSLILCTGMVTPSAFLYFSK